VKKVKEIPSKVKIISEKNETKSELEKDIEESEKESFEKFMETGKSVAPVIQPPSNLQNQQTERTTRGFAAPVDEESSIRETYSTARGNQQDNYYSSPTLRPVRLSFVDDRPQIFNEVQNNNLFENSRNDIIKELEEREKSYEEKQKELRKKYPGAY